jgi:hypothetical protein
LGRLHPFGKVGIHDIGDFLHHHGMKARMYWPKAEAISGELKKPPIQRVN